MPDSTSNEVSLPRWLAWAQLLRLPNVFTVIADVGAAYLLVAGGPEPVGPWIAVILSGIALYWAGMILNDVFDVERDRSERPGRPIPAGHIDLGQATKAGWLLLVAGVVLAALAGYLRDDVGAYHWLPLLVSLALAAMIVAYDGPLKRTPVAPVAMGACRVLSFLLGAVAAAELVPGEPRLPSYVLAAASGFGVYVMGITTMARREASGGRTPNLFVGWIVTIVGVAMMAMAPQLIDGPKGFHVAPNAFALLIAMVASPAVFRGLRAIYEPTPIKIQMAIRVGILTIIPLAACYAFLGAGPFWGLMIFLLTFPSISLSLRFRVT
jgi:4-hydroxybenzoate polyprenyltransferase